MNPDAAESSLSNFDRLMAEFEEERRQECAAIAKEKRLCFLG